MRTTVEAIQEEDDEDLQSNEEEQQVNEKELVDKESGEFVIFQNKDKEVEPQKNLEPAFDKLSYVNKINILLKALMIERNRNNENAIKM